jgi:glycerol-3-phosphate dehydrogenase
VVWSYSGVRPLLEDAAADASAVTRDYQLDLNTQGAPLLSIFGGKITTFRKLAEEAVDMIAPVLGNQRGAWTEHGCLPGGDLFGAQPSNRSVRQFDHYVQGLQQQYRGCRPLLQRYARAYGSRTHALLEGKKSLEEMGEEILGGLYAAEVDYLLRHEWATNAADILWRRSKLGLHFPKGSEAVLDAWLAARGGQSPGQEQPAEAGELLQAASR